MNFMPITSQPPTPAGPVASPFNSFHDALYQLERKEAMHALLTSVSVKEFLRNPCCWMYQTSEENELWALARTTLAKRLVASKAMPGVESFRLGMQDYFIEAIEWLEEVCLSSLTELEKQSYRLKRSARPEIQRSRLAQRDFHVI